MSRSRLIALLLGLATLLVFLPAARHGFSLFDDSDYVTENRIVQGGLSWTSVQWAFTTWHASNWHPLTWLSHMLDCELFGLNAGAHHFVNIVLHAANAMLLFTLLRRLTGRIWPSAFIAALFAWHPLRVESVAWIAERKDVLSTFFALLTLLIYAKYVEHSKSRRPTKKYYFALSLLTFGLGLLSKPMLVMLPFVLLLLDFWPLGRIQSENSKLPCWLRLLLEKTPFLLLASGSCVITFLAQHQGGMVVSLEEMSPGYRLANVPLAYWRYLEKLFWPAHLSILYPLPKTFSTLAVVLAVVALVAITVIVWLGRQRRPYGIVGWLWFLGTLVPVIGLVQVGQAAMSDRYSYFPGIGIFIVVTFAACELMKRFQIQPAAMAVMAGVVLGSCVVLSEKQLSCWRDDVALFSQAISVTKDNESAHLDLGLALEAAGRKTEALAEYRAGQQLNPYRVKTYNYIALVLAEGGQTNEAIAELQQGLRINSNDALTHARLARLLADANRPVEALAEFQTAVQINPKDTTTLNNFGMLLARLGRFDEAMKTYAEAVRRDPANWHSAYLMGLALLKQNRNPEAIPYFWQALQKNPDDIQLLIFVAQVLATNEDPNARDGRAAFDLASKANTLAGDEQPAILDVLGMACAELGNFEDAKTAAQNALRLMTAGGATNDSIPIQQRMQLYQQHQPFRQSFAGRATGETLKP